MIYVESLLKVLLGIGDCIIDGPNFEIDSSLRTQINNISTTLKELGVVDNDDIFGLLYG